MAHRQTEVADIWLQPTTHLSIPKEWKAESAWLADLQQTVYPHKWSPVSRRSSAGQQKFACQRPTFYHATCGCMKRLPAELHFRLSSLLRHWFSMTFLWSKIMQIYDVLAPNQRQWPTVSNSRLRMSAFHFWDIQRQVMALPWNRG